MVDQLYILYLPITINVCKMFSSNTCYCKNIHILFNLTMTQPSFQHFFCFIISTFQNQSIFIFSMQPYGGLFCKMIVFFNEKIPSMQFYEDLFCAFWGTWLLNQFLFCFFVRLGVTKSTSGMDFQLSFIMTVIVQNKKT